MMNELGDKMKESEGSRYSDASPRHHNHDNGFSPCQGYVSKLDFPKFDGSNVRMWVKKCIKYFALCKVLEDQKVDLACLNVIDKAENWVSSYLVVRKNVDWTEFVVDLFEDLEMNWVSM